MKFEIGVWVKAMNEFGGRVKALREIAGLTQSELAERAGLEKTAIYRAEIGKTYPQFETCVKIARGLGCTLGELIGEEEQDAAGTAELLAKALRDMAKIDSCEICAYWEDGKCKRPKGKQGAQCFEWRGLHGTNGRETA